MRTMTTLLILAAALVLLSALCARRARRGYARMMRHPDHWDGEDVERWLDLIEPFPLPDASRKKS